MPLFNIAAAKQSGLTDEEIKKYIEQRKKEGVNLEVVDEKTTPKGGNSVLMNALKGQNINLGETPATDPLFQNANKDVKNDFLTENLPTIGAVGASLIPGLGPLGIILAGGLGAGGGAVVKQAVDQKEGFDTGEVLKETALGAGGNIVGLGAGKLLSKVLPKTIATGFDDTAKAATKQPIEETLKNAAASAQASIFQVPRSSMRRMRINQTPKEVVRELLDDGVRLGSPEEFQALSQRANNVVNTFNERAVSAIKTPVDINPIRASVDDLISRATAVTGPAEKKVKTYLTKLLDNIGKESVEKVPGEISTPGMNLLKASRELGEQIEGLKGSMEGQGKATRKVFQSVKRQIDDLIDKMVDEEGIIATTKTDEVINAISEAISLTAAQKFAALNTIKEQRHFLQKYVNLDKIIKASEEAASGPSITSKGFIDTLAKPIQPVLDVVTDSLQQRGASLTSKLLYGLGDSNIGKTASGVAGATDNALSTLPPALTRALVLGGGQAAVPSDMSQAQASTMTPEMQKVLPGTAQTQEDTASSQMKEQVEQAKLKMMEALAVGDTKTAAAYEKYITAYEKYFTGEEDKGNLSEQQISGEASVIKLEELLGKKNLGYGPVLGNIYSKLYESAGGAGLSPEAVELITQYGTLTQEVIKGLQGSRSSDKDYAIISKYTPQPSDTDQQARTKVNTLLEMAKRLQEVRKRLGNPDIGISEVATVQ